MNLPEWWVFVFGGLFAVGWVAGMLPRWFPYGLTRRQRARWKAVQIVAAGMGLTVPPVPPRSIAMPPTHAIETRARFARRIVTVRRWDGHTIAEATIPVPPGTDVAATSAKVETLWVDGLDGEWVWDWQPARGFARVKIAEPWPDSQPAQPETNEPDQSPIRRLGVDRHGHQVSYDVDRYPHLAIGGATGAGKTNALHTLIRSDLAAGRSILISDPKMFELRGWQGHRGIIGFADDTDTAKTLVARVVTELNRRNKARADAIDARQPIPVCEPWTFVVDEVTELIAETGGTNPDRNPVVKGLARIGKLGRAVDIQLVVATQQFDVKEALPSSVRRQCQARLGIGRLGRQGAPMLYLHPYHDDRIPDDPPRGRGVLELAGAPYDIQIDVAPEVRPIRRPDPTEARHREDSHPPVPTPNATAWSVYVATCVTPDHRYVGITSWPIDRRTKQHERGKIRFTHWHGFKSLDVVDTGITTRKEAETVETAVGHQLAQEGFCVGGVNGFYNGKPTRCPHPGVLVDPPDKMPPAALLPPD